MADHNSANQICTLSAADAVALLHKGDISPLELVEASATRIAETDPALNALPTLCLDRARAHAERIIKDGQKRDDPAWLG
ncbi:MAG: amidase, partial [Rhodospirillaceae bacterium]|nr:amidase [Rhodospirillaceae bacterium]